MNTKNLLTFYNALARVCAGFLETATGASFYSDEWIKCKLLDRGITECNPDADIQKEVFSSLKWKLRGVQETSLCLVVPSSGFKFESILTMCSIGVARELIKEVGYALIKLTELDSRSASVKSNTLAQEALKSVNSRSEFFKEIMIDLLIQENGGSFLNMSNKEFIKHATQKRGETFNMEEAVRVIRFFIQLKKENGDIHTVIFAQALGIPFETKLWVVNQFKDPKELCEWFHAVLKMACEITRGTVSVPIRQFFYWLVLNRNTGIKEAATFMAFFPIVFIKCGRTGFGSMTASKLKNMICDEFSYEDTIKILEYQKEYPDTRAGKGMAFLKALKHRKYPNGGGFARMLSSVPTLVDQGSKTNNPNDPSMWGADKVKLVFRKCLTMSGYKCSETWLVTTPDAPGEYYHSSYHDCAVIYRKLVDRYNANRPLKEYMPPEDRTHVVYFEDSLESGNCSLGTKSWMEENGIKGEAIPLQHLISLADTTPLARNVAANVIAEIEKTSQNS